jgi:hypothetical protein
LGGVGNYINKGRKYDGQYGGPHKLTPITCETYDSSGPYHMIIRDRYAAQH